jgi:hypothetical protein
MTSEALRTWKRLFSAVLTLTCESGSVQERLADAYLSSLQPLHDDPALPELIRGDFAQLEAELPDIERAHELMREAICRMDSDRARRLAGRIVSMYDKLARQAA